MLLFAALATISQQRPGLPVTNDLLLGVKSVEPNEDLAVSIFMNLFSDHIIIIIFMLKAATTTSKPEPVSSAVLVTYKTTKETRKVRLIASTFL